MYIYNVKWYRYIYMYINIYTYTTRKWFCLVYISSTPLQADQKRRMEEQKRHDALMASLSVLTQRPAVPSPVAETSLENQQLKSMLQEALNKMDKMEKEMETLKRDTDEDHDDGDDDSEHEGDDNEEYLTTQDGKTAPSWNWFVICV